MRKTLLGALLALTLLLAEPAQAALAAPSPTPLPPLVQRETPANFSAVPVYLDGLLLSRACQWGDTVYVALRPLCHWAGLKMSWTGDAEHLSLELDGLKVECRAGDQYYLADGRYIYAPEDWFIFNWDLYLPQYALCRLFNLTAVREDDTIRLDAGKLSLLRGGKDYYALNFPMEDVYWLSHIIGSEAGIEPMEGKIGVGNVVLNRVADPDFPDTVYGVVYDFEHAVQFEPVSKGTIHDEPKKEDLIAAYLVLEGVNTAGDCIYFVNPDFGSFWFDNNLELVMQLGRHNFYVKREANDAGTTAGTDSAPGS